MMSFLFVKPRSHRRIGFATALALPIPLKKAIGCAIIAGLIALRVDHSSATDAASGGKHLLWKTTNTPAPCYLFGSIHSLRPPDFRRTPVITQAIKESQQFYFEIDPKQEDAFAKKLIEAAKYPSGVEIKDKINPKTYAYLRKITVSGFGRWQHLRPWAVAVLCLNHPGFIGMSSRYGIDTYVSQEARYWSKPTYGLETPDEHVRVLSDMFDAEGEVLLLQSLIYGEQGPQQFKGDLAAWKAGEADRIYANHMPELKSGPTVWWRLLDRRNASWVPKIETAIKSGKPTMVVAGALHFSGPRSVIALLEKKGYKFEQL